MWEAVTYYARYLLHATYWENVDGILREGEGLSCLAKGKLDVRVLPKSREDHKSSSLKQSYELGTIKAIAVHRVMLEFCTASRWRGLVPAKNPLSHTSCLAAPEASAARKKMHKPVEIWALRVGSS